MKVKDITSVLEQWAPLAYQESYDNSGLLVGDSECEIKEALITLDITEEVVDEAISVGANLIIAHHPLIFGGLKKITSSHWVQRCIIKAIKNDINIYAIHTNLDSVNSGVNFKIAEKIGLKNQRILSHKSDTLLKLVTFIPKPNVDDVLAALFDTGAGHIGEYSDCSFKTEGTGNFTPSMEANPTIGQVNEPETVQETRIEVLVPSHLQNKVLDALRKSHPYEEVSYFLTDLKNTNQEVGSGVVGDLKVSLVSEVFLDHLKRVMNLKIVKHTEITTQSIKKVAICGGSGSFLLKDAIASEADIFITADVKYHEFFEADSKIIFADIGHYESEIFTKDLIHDFLTQKLANIAFRLSGVDTNPVKIS